ncbi:MAG: type 11 methyltransferase [Bacteroidetes bacterium]|nr:MAG: type 11 methyltransferase [Bacteroidota bacterium]
MPGTEAAFDFHAASYDSTFTHSETGKRQRKRVHDYLEKKLDAALYKRVLELNCGTGEDAIWLARRGHEVTATDLSQKMIDLAERKSAEAKTTIRFQKTSFGEIASRFAPGSFDCIFSNFGGLNCIDYAAVKKLADDSAILLRPGGRFIAVIMGKNCSWEKFYFRLKGDRENRLRRKKNGGAEVMIGEEKFTTWYYSPAEIREAFSKQFAFADNIPVGWALPPSYLEPRFKNKKNLLAFLHGIENMCSPFSFAVNRADHFLIDFGRTGAGDARESGNFGIPQ